MAKEKTPCPHCKGEYANLEGHIQNVHPDKTSQPPTPPAPPETPSGEFVGKQEFESFKEENSKTQLEILKAIENLGKPSDSASNGRVFSVTKPEQPERKMTEADAGPQDPRSTLTPEQQAIFEEYFDPADGFTASFKYPYFSILVPDKFSNADAAWKKYYAKTGDVRVKFLRYDNLEGGMRDWCKMVAGNIKYNKNVRTK